MTASTQEDFLRSFHARHAGVTARVLEHGRAADGRSSYELLRDKVNGADRVLDLGCGDGFLLELLAADDHSELIGLDLSEDELAAARRRPALAGARLVHGRAQAMPFEDGTADACLSHMAFMLMSDIDQVASELARVLVPGGKLALVIGGGSRTGAFELFTRLSGQVLDSVPAEDRMPQLGDRRVRTRAGLDEILVPAGFAPAGWESVSIDLSGSVEQVWNAVSCIYNIFVLDDEAVAALRADFFVQARAMALPDGRVPCSMVLHEASTHLL